jgi:ATP-dependent helicase/nuclease subunit A
MTGAEARRRPAADPAASVWVAASAGTGKTTVLTDRLLALLLDGTDPGRVLCLTFTRAAAAEMANRLDGQLARWATLPDGRLAEELTALAGAFPDAERLARARQLFARVLDTPGGLKIATIHAFCQSLLRRFPLEARVPPEFAVIDERSAGDLLIEAGERIIAAARAGRSPGLAKALATVARYAPEERFAQLLHALAGARGKVAALFARGHGALRRQIAAALGYSDAAFEGLVESFCAGGDLAGLREAAAALACGSKTDRQRGSTLARWCDVAAERPAMLAEYLRAFLTQKNEIRDRLITRDAALAAPNAACAIAAEAERVKAFRDARAAAAVCDATAALLRLGDALIEAYEAKKRAAGALDYDDLVLKALALLRRPGVAPWVLFKLDGGLDHILIDEAQDTNPEQWEIVAALAEEFFSGGDNDAAARTIFAVGDVKQSIYSFQGADPQGFLRMRRHFEERVNAARRDWRIVPLEVSHRSTEPVLRAVDAIFRLPAAYDGVALDGAAIRHVAARRGAAGIVELWPPVLPEPEAAEEPPLPVARRHVAEPRSRLAEMIAATIRHWLDTGERLAARARPIAAGDVMVLVRRRNEFVADLVRALKARKVAVAGVDRLVLTEQLAVQDLIALGQFLLLPEDDLTLATVLKGPLFAISEETLYELAYDRGDVRLWRRLRDRAAADPALRPVAARLAELLGRADFSPPYELYAEILSAEGGRREILERLGPEAGDPIDEFLSLALSYQREHVPSLQGFLRWLTAGDSEVKRDFGMRRRDEVRILTVHGAKGLEAPIVFLPDTMQLPNALPPLLWPEEGGVPLWCPRQELAVPACRTAKDAQRERQLQEYRRLLYVALTRAEDRLYICGWETRRPAGERSWYALCRAGLAGVGTPFAFDARPLIGEDGWAGEGLRLAAAQTAAPRLQAAAPAIATAGPLPLWAVRPAPSEPDPSRPLAPSRPEGVEPAAMSPLALAGRDRFRRGLLIHRLLQSLPDLAAGEREAAARRFLALPAHGLPADEQDDICRATLAVLQHPDFAPLFGPGSQAEVPLVGLIGGHALSGQIDRLVVDGERVMIVDYKTLRPPPESETEVAPIYLRQLAVYRAALARIYPGREISCALLWTEGPRLMPISPERLAGWPA